MDEDQGAGAGAGHRGGGGDEPDLYENDGALEADADMAVAVPPTLDAGSPWEQTLNRLIPAIVSIRFICVRNFDTEQRRTSQATGFIIDRERGLILTNRHVVTPGPIIAEAILKNKEEVRIYPVYRDPVHDFGVFRFSTKEVKYMDLVEIPLAPELARIGADVRVVGNDSGERLSILSGVMARLDRKAPTYGVGRFNDFNTFYYQAASMTSGGSSGSPVLDISGHCVALNAGGATGAAASSFFLPLDRVVRALEYIKEGKEVPRGDIQAVFKHAAYDEVRRLGLKEELEGEMRRAFPDGEGMLVVSQVVPQGPADGKLEAGDIVLRMNGQLLTTFVPLEEILDSNVGNEVTFEIHRGPNILSVSVTVEDLHSTMPRRYVEVGGGILHDLSYQMARGFMVPCSGVYVASAGYMLSLAGVSRKCIITSLDNQSTPHLDDFVRIFAQLKDGDRVGLRYYALGDVNKEKLGILQVDRKWHAFSVATRDDVSGLWHYTYPECTTGTAVPKPHSAARIHIDNPIADKIVPALVLIEFRMPFKVDGTSLLVHTGIGVVVDREKGLIVTDRHSVPTAMGDVVLTFANSVLVQGRVVFIHQLYNIAVLAYDTKVLGDTEVAEIEWSDKKLAQGDTVLQVCLTKSFHVVVRSTVVTNVRAFFITETLPPTFRATNQEGIELDNPLAAYGVLCDPETGKVQSVWIAYTKYSSKGSRHEFGMGFPADLLLPFLNILRQGVVPRLMCPEIELGYAHVAQARLLGVPDEWVKRIEGGQSSRRNVVVVRRVTSGTEAGEILKEGDLILAVDSTVATVFTDVVGYPDKTELLLTTFRNGSVFEAKVPASELSPIGTTRIVGWAGAVFQMPHRQVYSQLKKVPNGVYCAVVFSGSPAELYGLRSMTWVTEIGGKPINDLDSMLAAVQAVPDETFVLVKMYHAFSRQTKVLSIRNNEHYYSTWEIVGVSKKRKPSVVGNGDASAMVVDSPESPDSERLERWTDHEIVWTLQKPDGAPRAAS
ncbi:trypsin-like cysteine/serine peptidase domain-containing protein [Hyaloraphidium curvatum]|nr:trypsin-like cysteine/serine peptidase domain-containing protein [Hyaloraphidium curvatum]